MKRKVIKLAEKTLVVSLPAAWCKTNGIRKGDEVQCDERRSSVIISKQSPAKKASAELDGDAAGILVKRTINELYHAGVDRVSIYARKPQTIAYVKETLNQLLGYHIVEQQAGSIVLEDLGKTDQNLDMLFRRFLLIIKTMVEDGVRAIAQKNTDELHAIAHRDIEVNKFAHLCIRTLSKNPQLDSDTAARMHTLIYQAEQLADEYKNLLLACIEHPSNGAAHEDLFRNAALVYDTAYQFLYQRTRTNAHAVAAAYSHALREIRTQKNNAFSSSLEAFVKKAVSIQELFLHQSQDVHHGTP